MATHNGMRKFREIKNKPKKKIYQNARERASLQHPPFGHTHTRPDRPSNVLLAIPSPSHLNVRFVFHESVRFQSLMMFGINKSTFRLYNSCAIKHITPLQTLCETHPLLSLLPLSRPPTLSLVTVCAPPFHRPVEPSEWPPKLNILPLPSLASASVSVPNTPAHAPPLHNQRTRTTRTGTSLTTDPTSCLPPLLARKTVRVGVSCSVRSWATLIVPRRRTRGTGGRTSV